MSGHHPPPLLVVAGPTASGKSRLGLEVAEALGAEVVSADAFAVYRGLDIGTDKPGPEARGRVRHHLIDVADPAEAFSAGAWADAASQTIADIGKRGRTPVVVGGTHFYLRALILGLCPAPPADATTRARLAAAWERDPDALHQRLAAADPEAAARIGARDRQRVLRALEVFELTGEPLTRLWRRHPQAPRYRALVVVPRRARADLYARIELRVDRMFAAGLVEEVGRILAAGVSPEAHALKAIGYREVVALLDGRHDLATAVAETKRASRRLAKRQLSWLRAMREGDVVATPPAEEGGADTVLEMWKRHDQGSESR